MIKPRVVRHVVEQPLDESYRFIPLTRNQNAIVDAEDYEYLSQWCWYAEWDPDLHSYYANRRPTDGKRIHMHREIMKTPEGMLVDHKNHNTLDNRKENLRNCTHGQNQANRRVSKNNSSGFQGVHWRTNRNCWCFTIRLGRGKRIKRSGFKTTEEAARAYDAVAKEFHGEFANLNFPD